MKTLGKENPVLQGLDYHLHFWFRCSAPRQPTTPILIEEAQFTVPPMEAQLQEPCLGITLPGFYTGIVFKPTARIVTHHSPSCISSAVNWRSWFNWASRPLADLRFSDSPKQHYMTLLKLFILIPPWVVMVFIQPTVLFVLYFCFPSGSPKTLTSLLYRVSSLWPEAAVWSSRCDRSGPQTPLWKERFQKAKHGPWVSGKLQQVSSTWSGCFLLADLLFFRLIIVFPEARK